MQLKLLGSEFVLTNDDDDDDDAISLSRTGIGEKDCMHV